MFTTASPQPIGTVLSHKGRKIVMPVIVAIAAIPLLVAATAFACANLVTAKALTSGGTPGSEITVVARNLNNSAAASAAQMRFNSRSGPVLFEGRPSSGKLVGKITVPNVKPGKYVVIVTQLGPNGRMVAGAPGRAAIVVKSATGAATASPGAPWAAPSGGSGPGTPLAVPFGLGVLALALVGGATALAAGSRRRSAPSAVPSAS